MGLETCTREFFSGEERGGEDVVSMALWTGEFGSEEEEYLLG